MNFACLPAFTDIKGLNSVLSLIPYILLLSRMNSASSEFRRICLSKRVYRHKKKPLSLNEPIYSNRRELNSNRLDYRTFQQIQFSLVICLVFKHIINTVITICLYAKCIAVNLLVAGPAVRSSMLYNALY